MNRGVFGVPKRKETHRVYDQWFPPASPSPVNDEFTYEYQGSEPPGWLNVGAVTPSIVVKNSHMDFSCAGSSSLSAVERPIPQGPFTVATFCQQASILPLNIPALYVRNAASGQIMQVGMFQNSANLQDNYLSWERYSSFTTRTAVTFYNFDYNACFFRLDFDGTTIRAQFSYDGIHWITLNSESIGTQFGAGSPDRVGFSLRSETGNPARRAFRFLRHFPYANADIGRMITKEVEP